MEYPKVYAVDFDGTLNTAKTYTELGAQDWSYFSF